MAEATEHAPRQDCIGRGHLTNLRRHCHVDIPNQMQLGTSMVQASLETYNLRKSASWAQTSARSRLWSWRSMPIKTIPKINTEDNKDLPKHSYNCANHTYIQKIPKPIICTTPYKLTTRTTELEQFGASSKEFHESPRMTHAAGTRDQHLQQEMNQSTKPTKNKKNITRRISPFMPSFFLHKEDTSSDSITMI